MSTTTRSAFASALEDLLDKTKLFSRSEWAEVLGVSPPAISQWVNDKTIPRADNLSMIVTTLEQSSHVPPEPLAAFREMARRVATEVSPHGKRMLPTVAEYMARPGFSELSSQLAKLPPAEQEKLLEKLFPPRAAKRPAEELREVAEVSPAGSGSMEPVPADTAPTVTPEPVPDPIPVSRFAEAAAMSARTAAPSRSPHGEGSERVSETPARTLSVYITPTFLRLADEEPEQPVGRPVPWEEVSKNTIRIGVIGRAGVGKTSFLKHLLHQLKDKASPASRAWSGRVPAYIQLHQLPALESSTDLWDALRDVLAAPRERTLLLLDGFDEVRLERREGLARAISGLRESSPQTGVVLTSRPTPDIRALRHITKCSLQTPPDSRLLVLAYNRASSAVADSERWDDALLQVGSCFRERPDVFRALGNPLLLSYAVRLFAKKSLGACRDADLLDSCLTFLFEGWDEEKKVVRSRSAWTSTSSRSLYQWLGGLCYHSLVNQVSEFTGEHIARWFRDSSDKLPVEADLKAIAESTGVIEPSVGSRWRIVHQTIREYLAARYVVESSRDATDYLRPPAHGSWVSSVLQFACSITHDASPLLTFVLESPWGSRVGKMATLAGMVAQQLKASDDVLERSCDTLVGLLEEPFTDWRLATSEEESEVFPEPKWRLAARCKESQRSAEGPGKEVLQTIKAMHRARLSPARTLLSKRLARSTNEVIRGFGESLDVEGYMEGRSFSRGGSDIFAAEVCEI